jgi:hypothetical protein
MWAVGGEGADDADDAALKHIDATRAINETADSAAGLRHLPRCCPILMSSVLPFVVPCFSYPAAHTPAVEI